jgi:hypothetical protein
MNVRGVCVGMASLLVVSASVLGANAASADSVQVQSYQRASQEQACSAQPGETPWQANWGSDSSWKPSWEQWANGGKGGWTCTRSITWARDAVTARTYGLGDIGPGGGLVFLISGGLTYEMAPNTWSAGGLEENSLIRWCSDGSSNISGAAGTTVGTGSANTTAMQSPACASGAAVTARAYLGGGYSDWFLPYKDELNSMCNYSRNPTTPPSGTCTGGQNGTFASSAYGFPSTEYWTSSQRNNLTAWNQDLDSGPQSGLYGKGTEFTVRPIRAF